ncbi:MAG: hypothetical protein WA060_00250 [Minisyncoccia bacterium]
MKRLLTFILIVSFVGIAFFGFTVFAHGMNSSDNNCVTSPIDGTVCPTSIVAMTLHHISSLQTLLTSVTPSMSSLLMLLAFILLVSVSIFQLYKNLLFPKLELLRKRLHDLETNLSYSKQKIISWLSLFENSPSFSYVRHS